MPAHEHLSPKLFHGSAHIFAEGEMIDPAQSTQNYFDVDGNYPSPEHTEDWQGKPTVSASTSYERAASKASSKAQSQGMLFAPVYEVPTDSFTMLKDIIPQDHVNDNTKTTALSKEKVKPGKIVGWANNPLASTEGVGDRFYAKRSMK